MANLKQISTHDLKSTLRLSLAFAALVVLIPSIISDAGNLTWLIFSGYWSFLVSKVLVWLLFPAGLLMLVGFSFGWRSWLYWALIAFFVANLALFLGFSTVSSCFGGILCAIGWRYGVTVILEFALIPVIAAMVVILWIGLDRFSSDNFDTLYLRNTGAYDAPVRYDNDFYPQRLGQLPHSVYIIVFDELSAESLGDLSQPNSAFPNFRKLSERAIVPPRATTNYDLTSLAIPTMLTGRLVDAKTDPEVYVEAMFALPNLFDVVAPEQLFVWGPAVIPYCRSLNFKNHKGYCLDNHVLHKSIQMDVILRLELWRFAHQVVLPILDWGGKVLASRWGSVAFVDAIERSLNRDYVKSKFITKWFSNALEIERLRDFVDKAGSVKGGVYFYHCFLPHHPFVMSRDLSWRDIDNEAAFHLARDRSELQSIKKRYLEQVAAADTMLGQMISAIDEKDPNSIVIVTADHGASSNFDTGLSRASGNYIDEVVDIPFFVSVPPGLPHSSSEASAYQHLDLIPTVFDLFGLPANPRWEGESIFSVKASPFFYRSKEKIYSKYFVK